MKINYNIILWFYLLSQIAAAKVMSLEEIKYHAHKNNFVLNAARFDTKAHEKNEAQQIAKLLPKVGLRAGVEKTKNDTTKDTEHTKSVYLEYNVFNGFKDSIALKQSRLDTKKSISHLRETDINLSLTVEKMYYEYLYLFKISQITDDALKRNQFHLSLIKKRLDSSLVTKTDLLEFELSRAKLISASEFIQLKMEELSSHLFRVAGIENPTEVTLSGELPHLTIENSIEDLIEILPTSSESVQRMVINIEKNTYEQKSVYGQWLPKIDLEADYGNLPEHQTSLDPSLRSSAITLKAKWELFSGFSSYHQKGRISAIKIKNEFLLKQKLLDSESQIRSHYQLIKALQKRILAEEDNAKLAREYYKNMIKEYQRGIKDSGALSSAGDQLTEIDEKVYELKNLYIQSKLSLELILNRPVIFKNYVHRN